LMNFKRKRNGDGLKISKKLLKRITSIMNPEVKDLVLRVHTRVESARPTRSRSRDLFDSQLPKWAEHALVIDCETTTEELGQKLNFAFYRKCKLIDDEYRTIEEGIVFADDLVKRFGEKTLNLLRKIRSH